MKKILSTLFFVLALTISCKSSKSIGTSMKQIEVSIEQNGKVVEPTNGVITLKKEPFNIVVVFPGPMSVLLNSSYDDRLYKLALEGEQLTGLPEFNKSNVGAVALKNPDQEVYLTEGSSIPLFFENKNEHTFNFIEKKRNRLRCVQYVKQFLHEDSPDPVALHIIDDPIYMVFVSSEMAVETPKDVTFHGKHLKIEWKE